jgi:hypothetical protein
MLCAASAAAQNRTFVSATGIDNASCSRTSPCRSFNAAIAVVVTGGEVIALDSGGYGAASVNKAISIVAPLGVYAGVSVTSGAGIEISAPAANVTLKGLSINGVGGTTGIQVDTVGQLHIENVLVTALGDGLLVYAATSFVVRDSVFRSNIYGIDIPNAFAPIAGFVERTRFDENSSAGGTIGDYAQVDFSESTFFNNGDGFTVQPASAAASVFVDQCMFSRGNRGLNLQPSTASGTATAVVGRTTFYRVNDPLHRGGNPTNTFTFANNQVAGNSYSPLFDTALALR